METQETVYTYTKNNMASQPDPLALLRDATINTLPVNLLSATGEEVNEMPQAEMIQFGDIRFPRKTPTNFRKTGEEFYTLEALVYFLQNSNLSNRDYVQKCGTSGIQIVSVTQKNSVMNYLMGKVETDPNVMVREEPPTKDNKRSLEETAEASHDDAKRLRLEKSKATDLDVVKKIMNNEKPLRTKGSVLKGNKSFEQLLATFDEVWKRKSESDKNPALKGKSAITPSTSARSGHSSSRHQPSLQSKPGKPLSREQRTPIIIVPSAPTAMLTLYNVKKFLEEQIFISPQECREQNIPKPQQVQIEHCKSTGQTVIYKVVDKTDGFKPADWERVICVFTSGQEWQFKNWKWTNPTEIFANVKGFIAMYDGEQLKDPVAKWAVTPVKIHRNRQHALAAEVTRFWDTLESYAARSKSHLLV